MSLRNKPCVRFDLTPTYIPRPDPTTYRYNISIEENFPGLDFKQSVKRIKQLLHNPSVNFVITRCIESIEKSVGEDEMAMRRLSQANTAASSALINESERTARSRYLSAITLETKEWYRARIEEMADKRIRKCRLAPMVRVKEIERIVREDDYDEYEEYENEDGTGFVLKKRSLSDNEETLEEYEERVKTKSSHTVMRRKRRLPKL
ncbi:uncharacterized protein PV09_05071 [Verruconis gallopava]|uniref:Uncharacterized protein n=1 Tax=Verruconis gallopava TaxID=253628 RepID=A0A0D1YSZ7_9PEZI|nr:uncharacterized protein PV09_05071 [Verruconis gallopava]KIW03767.1 hypothetical protein PV09_05071 [Verruconis gallopava]